MAKPNSRTPLISKSGLSPNREAGAPRNTTDAKAKSSASRQIASRALAPHPKEERQAAASHRQSRDPERRTGPVKAAHEEPDSRLEASEGRSRKKLGPAGKSDGSEAKPPLGFAASGQASAQANLSNAKPARSGGDDDPSIDAKKVVKRSSAPRLTLLDLRHSAGAKNESSSGIIAKADDTPKGSIPDARAAGSDGGRGEYRELSLGARGTEDTRRSSSVGKSESLPGREQDFRSMLADRLREAWNGEIVQSARIVLKDGDAGTIRLRLRPESLGNVKIELNLSENNISGRILVESDAAKSAFEKNMSELSDAFRQGGFDSARLEVAVGGGSGGSSSRDESREPFYSERLRTVVGSAADPATATSAYARRGGAVDILA